MQHGWNIPRVACLAALLLAAGAAAEEGAEAPAPPAVSLDRLLKLPPTVEVRDPRPGGASRSEWEARFAEVREQRAAAQAALEAAQAELGELADDTSQWKMKAPGLGGAGQASAGESGPMSYRLSKEIRRHREDIEAADRRLQELRVEANLAGVPEEWMEPERTQPQQ